MLHRGAQDRVDPSLISRMLPKVLEHVAIQPDADLLLGFRQDQRGRCEPVFVEDRRGVRIIPNGRFDLFVGQRINVYPISLATVCAGA